MHRTTPHSSLSKQHNSFANLHKNELIVLEIFKDHFIDEKYYPADKVNNQ
jgi:hypothetical protein